MLITHAEMILPLSDSHHGVLDAFQAVVGTLQLSPIPEKIVQAFLDHTLHQATFAPDDPLFVALIESHHSVARNFSDRIQASLLTALTCVLLKTPGSDAAIAHIHAPITRSLTEQVSLPPPWLSLE
jgi:hypothetical protein